MTQEEIQETVLERSKPESWYDLLKVIERLLEINRELKEDIEAVRIEYKEKVEQLKKRVHNLESEVNHFQKQIKGFKREIRENDKEINIQEEIISSRENEINEYKKAIWEASRRIRGLADELGKVPELPEDLIEDENLKKIKILLCVPNSFAGNSELKLLRDHFSDKSNIIIDRYVMQMRAQSIPVADIYLVHKTMAHKESSRLKERADGIVLYYRNNDVIDDIERKVEELEEM